VWRRSTTPTFSSPAAESAFETRVRSVSRVADALQERLERSPAIPTLQRPDAGEGINPSSRRYRSDLLFGTCDWRALLASHVVLSMKQSLETASGSRALVVLSEGRSLAPLDADRLCRNGYKQKLSSRLLVAVWLTRGILLAGAVWLVAASVPWDLLASGTGFARADFVDRISTASVVMDQPVVIVPARHSGLTRGEVVDSTIAQVGAVPEGQGGFAPTGVGGGSEPVAVPLPARDHVDAVADGSADAPAEDAGYAAIPLIPVRSPLQKQAVGQGTERSSKQTIEYPMFPDAKRGLAKPTNVAASDPSKARARALKFRMPVDRKSSVKSGRKPRSNRRAAKPRLHDIRKFNRRISRGLQRTGRALRRGIARILSR